MLECNRIIHKKLTAFVRVVSLLLPIVCVMLLLSQVVFAKNTYVINDGDRVVVHTTYTTDPIEVLNEAGLELGEDDTYTTQEGVGRSEITIQRQQVVGVVCGGQSLTVTTYGETVESLLTGLDLLPGKYDKVSAELDAETYDGMCIVITRCVTLEETYTASVPYGTLYVLDTALADGEQKLLYPGTEGQVQNTDTVSYLDGAEVSRENTNQTVISEPVSQILAVSSLEGIAEESVITLNQEQPSEDAPEATIGNGELFIGDGIIITADGQILTFTDTMQVKATAYTHTDAGCDKTTATGTTVHVGTVAVDPRLIPYGTRMFIVTNDGRYIYGISVAEDCGGSIKGNRIDLYFETDAECWTFGVRNATIYFLG